MASIVRISIFEHGDGRRFDAGELGEIKKKLIMSDAPWQIGLLQHGMESGKHSVMLNILLPDGTLVVLEQSYANWELMSGAFAGAVQRWAEKGNRV